MKVLVTGASGFVGSHVTRLLIERGCDVAVLLRGSSSREWLEGLPLEIREGSLSDQSSLEKAVLGVDRVVHVAGVVHAPNREGYFEHNAKGTRRLIEACATQNPTLSRFVLISSLAAGGPSLSGAVRSEFDPDQPVSSYGESKRAGELEVLGFKEQVSSVILRPPLVYGPRDRGVLEIARIASKGLMPLLPSDPPQSGPKRYSQIFGEDLAEGIVEATLSERRLDSGSVFYVASPEIVTEAQIYEAFADALGKKLKRISIPAWGVKGLARGADLIGRWAGRSFILNSDKVPELLAPAWTCSAERALEQLGFAAKTSFKEGIRQTARWYLEKGWVR